MTEDTSQNVQPGSVDVTSLPADVQAYIAEQVAKAVAAANAPTPEHVDTPDEALAKKVARVRSELGPNFEQLAEALEEIRDRIVGTKEGN